jgi:hypothetical protein
MGQDAPAASPAPAAPATTPAAGDESTPAAPPAATPAPDVAPATPPAGGQPPVMTPSPDAARGTAPAGTAQPPSTPGTGSPTPADQPASEESQAASPPEFSAEDVLREFQRQRPRAEPILPTPSQDENIVRTAPTSGLGRSGRGRMPDGYFLQDRAGRLTQEGNWWVFNFISDNNPDLTPDPPIKVLPNQMLERAIRESQGGTASVEFIVSGEVTDFLCENYLLMRKMLRKRELGNLSP